MNNRTNNGALDDFRGIGWAFPIEESPGAETNQVAVARLEESIRQSILLILGTAKGERVMRPTFGSGIHDLVFAPNDTATAALASYEVREAITEWEPRVEIMDIKVEPDIEEGNKLLIHLEYRVRATNNRFNLVYPFYLERSGV
jgi:phage baseplate assembly protein W